MENLDILLIMSGITFLHYMKKEHDNKCKKNCEVNISKKNKKKNSSEKLSSSNESNHVLNKKIKDYNNMKYIINSIKRL